MLFDPGRGINLRPELSAVAAGISRARLPCAVSMISPASIPSKYGGDLVAIPVGASGKARSAWEGSRPPEIGWVAGRSDEYTEEVALNGSEQLRRERCGCGI
jgi:hypothetical protein